MNTNDKEVQEVLDNMLRIQTEEVIKLWDALLSDVGMLSTWHVHGWLKSGHAFPTIVKGIVKTARKNIKVGGTLDLNSAIRFASNVMNNGTRFIALGGVPALNSERQLPVLEGASQ